MASNQYGFQVPTGFEGPALTQQSGVAVRATAFPDILTNSRGLPWTESGFRASWSKAFNETALSDLHFNDLRGTAVINLADAGCSIPEIASITGHKLKSVHGILERYWSPTSNSSRQCRGEDRGL